MQASRKIDGKSLGRLENANVPKKIPEIPWPSGKCKRPGKLLEIASPSGKCRRPGKSIRRLEMQASAQFRKKKSLAIETTQTFREKKP